MRLATLCPPMQKPRHSLHSASSLWIEGARIERAAFLIPRLEGLLLRRFAGRWRSFLGFRDASWKRELISPVEPHQPGLYIDRSPGPQRIAVARRTTTTTTLLFILFLPVQLHCDRRVPGKSDYGALHVRGGGRGASGARDRYPVAQFKRLHGLQLSLQSRRGQDFGKLLRLGAAKCQRFPLFLDLSLILLDLRQHRFRLLILLVCGSYWSEIFRKVLYGT
mmetsp:Transcript_23323/g.45497  ORF Transcript_23323/g.45497 Transcript_23323/m.45497 type:complete len:221 (+) Transcript_23323:107-769(+)